MNLGELKKKLAKYSEEDNELEVLLVKIYSISKVEKIAHSIEKGKTQAEYIYKPRIRKETIKCL